jgi:hypothetical protein
LTALQGCGKNCVRWIARVSRQRQEHCKHGACKGHL